MIPKELYPTPEDIAYKMTHLVDFKRVHTILEPSAGYGNLATVAIKVFDREHGIWKLSEREKEPFPADVIDLVEIDEKCRAFLQSKQGNIIGNDFLTLKTFKRYDLIIMNPPFSDGVKHLLKAIEMQKYGGQIVCLLNSETINNPYTVERKVLLQKIEQYEGTVYDYGACFQHSERPTDVNISCVYINIPKGKQSDILDGLERAKEVEEQREEDCGQLSTEVEEYMRAIVGQYQRECEAGLKLINEYYAISSKTLTSFTDKYASPILELKVRGSGSGSIENRFLESVRYKYWDTLFHRPEICARMTGEMQDEFLSRLDELKRIEFNLSNIYEIHIKMAKKNIESVEKAILDLAHEFSRDYSWYPECTNNVHYYNGWATNKCGIINKKVIIPLQGFEDDWYGRGKRLSLDYKPTRKIADIAKVFSFFDTGNTAIWDEVSRIMSAAQEKCQSQNIEFRYFYVTFYKKGTAHITFKDMELLKRFNIFVGRKEGGLPPSYGKKAYSDMSEREKSIIDEFQGEDDYNKVYLDPEKYIVEGESLLALEATREGV